MKTLTKADLELSWDTYTKSWSTTDASRRLEEFARCLNHECVYTDPLVQATGYDELSAYMSELHKKISGVKFLTTSFKNHHDRSLVHWDMLDGNENVLTQGVSYGLYGADGRLLQMTGFY